MIAASLVPRERKEEAAHPPARSRMRERRLLVVVFFASGVLAARKARADVPYSLVYRAPEGCPTDDAFRLDVSSHARDPTAAAGARFDVGITREDDVFVGDIAVKNAAGETGRRTVRGKTCLEVAQALALITGLAIDLGGHIEGGSRPVAPPPPPPRPLPLPPARPRHPPRAGLEVALHLAAGLVGGLSSAPRPAGEVGVSLGSGGRNLFSPWGRASFVVSGSTLANSVGKADLLLFLGRVEGCPFRLQPGAFVFAVCGGLGIGAVIARAEGVVNPASDTQPWFSLETFVHAEWKVTQRFFLGADGGLSFPMHRNRYYFVPESTLYVEPRVAGRGAIGAGVRF
jgi:hypothetical protein